MRSDETLRLILAAAGAALWFAYPFIFVRGHHAIFLYHCRALPLVNGRDPCLSVGLELIVPMVFALTLLLSVPFLKLAAFLFAPDPDQRCLAWPLAPRSTREDRHPIPMIFCVVGLAWLFWNAKIYPIALYQYWLYWIAWAIWFGAGAVFSRPPKITSTAS